MNLNIKNLPPALKKRLVVMLVVMIVLIIWDFYSLFLKIQKSNGNISPIIALGMDTLTFIFLYLDIRQSKLYKTKYFYVLLIAASLFLLGFLFRLEHWGGAKELFVFSCGIAVITYLVYFFQKQKKYRNDWIKLVWVLSACVGASLIMLKMITPYYCMFTSVLFYVVFITQLKTILGSLFQRINQNPFNNIR